jgi:hypothetical protein
MSAIQYINSIAVFQGAQGKYYVVDGQKYHIRFPIEWAHKHEFGDGEWTDEELASDGPGPKNCGNCKLYGSIRNVFVGYCCNCLRNLIEHDDPRGQRVAIGLAVCDLENADMWQKYPYLYGVKKSEIGDEEGAYVTDEGVNLERLRAAMLDSEGEVDDDEGEVDDDEETVCDDTFDNVSILSDDATINS